MEMSKEMAGALLAAQRATRSVQKDSKNKHHDYQYASAEDVISHSRAVLGAAGLTLIADEYTVRGAVLLPRDKEAAPDTNPARVESAVLRCRYVLTHEGGSAWPITSETPIVPEKGRPADKAVASAKTYDLSYTLRALLLLPRGVDDDDPDARDDRPEADAMEQVKERVRALFRAMGTDVAARAAGMPEASWTIDMWREAEKRLAAEQERRVAAAKEIAK